MNVKINADVFNNSASVDKFLQLQFILHIIFYGNRYSLVLDDDKVLSSKAYNKLTDEEKDVIKLNLATTIIQDDQADCEIKENGSSEYISRIFSPTEAVMYLLQPITILLENGVYDSYFIKALIKIYDQGGRLQNFISNNWLRFGNGGGCTNMLTLLKSQVEFFGGKSKFMKVYVLVDSDKRYPSDNIDKYGPLISYLTETNIPYHILSKRSMENYLPEESYDVFVKGRTRHEIEIWKNAYISLSAKQKDFLSISSGLNKDAKADDIEKRKIARKVRKAKNEKNKNSLNLRLKLPKEERELFSNVGDGNLIILSKGLPIGNFKKEFPKAFDHYSVNRKSMGKRTPSNPNSGENELQQIISEIEKLS